MGLTIIEETDVGETDLAKTLLEGIEGGAVLHDVEAVALGKTEQVLVVLAARSRLGLGLEVASATAEEDVDHGAEGVAVADLLGGNLVIAVAVLDVRGVHWKTTFC